MPMTVITLTKVPPSLRGDLTKWMQEIANGVYIGNFNTRIRQRLWQRIIKNVGKGEATISYTHRNELGYEFDTYQTYRQPINYEGVPLVRIPKSDNNEEIKHGFSDIAKFTKIKKINEHHHTTKNNILPTYVVLDIETSGLDENKDQIIEIGAVKVTPNKIDTLDLLIQNDRKISSKVQKLTGITDDLLKNQGKSLKESLLRLKSFVKNYVIVGYNVNFDMNFLNYNLNEPLTNNIIDIFQLVTKEKMFLSNYHLETVLLSYGINQNVPHRALPDAKLTKLLATKVNKFSRMLKRKS